MSISLLSDDEHEPRDINTSVTAAANSPWSEEQARLLLWRVGTGDASAFEQFYHRYAPRLSAFITRYLKDSERVAEVVNEVMLVVWQQAALFRPTCCVSTWLFGIARHKAQKARTRLQPFPPMADMDSDQDNPERLFWQWERSRQVTRAVASLPPEQRIVIELTYYHACSTREIAQRLEEAEATVRSRLRLARQRLAQRLTRQGLASIELP